MVEPLRHRQTKGAATDMFYLTPPRHISTLPKTVLTAPKRHFRSTNMNGHRQTGPVGPFRATCGLTRRSKQRLFDHLVGAAPEVDLKQKGRMRLRQQPLGPRDAASQIAHVQ
jgi:hypothetical protein